MRLGENTGIDAAAPLHAAIQQIEESRKGIAVVIDAARKVIGTVTDGDIRRAILQGRDLNSPVLEAMNASPLTAPVDLAPAEISILLKENNLEALPLVDEAAAFQGIVHLRDLAPTSVQAGGAAGFAAAVIMAGGEGQRLRPLTETVPKPMIEVGGMPMIERHVRHLAKAGLKRVFLSVNYLADVIEDHFAKIGDLGIEIDYLREDQKLGTAGALTLLPKLGPGPLLVFNSDVLHNADYGNIFNYHRENRVDVTVAAIEHYIQIPYGVMVTKNGLLAKLEEKPSQKFLCNAGIYVVSEAARAKLATGAPIDMTTFLQNLTDNGLKVAVYPIHEYWADVADLDDLERVRAEIGKLR